MQCVLRFNDKQPTSGHLTFWFVVALTWKARSLRGQGRELSGWQSDSREPQMDLPASTPNEDVKKDRVLAYRTIHKALCRA